MMDLGATLRLLRQQAGISLAGVESRTRGEFKAVVVGSYERGDRQPSVERAAALLAVYGARLEIVHPGDVVVPATAGTVDEGHVEWLVVYSWVGLDPEHVIECEDLAEARRVHAAIPGSRVGYRAHTVGRICYDIAGGVS